MAIPFIGRRRSMSMSENESTPGGEWVMNLRGMAVAVARARHSESFAAAMLVVACMCWAAFFSLCKNWQEAAHACPGGDLVASLTLLGVRTVFALATLAILRPGLFL